MVGKILIIALFSLLGIMLSLGKWSFLIAVFNTMTKEEKGKVKLKGSLYYEN